LGGGLVVGYGIVLVPVAGCGDFGIVLRYADLQEVRAWWAGAQLDIAGVLAVRKPEFVLSVLL
jgi:hypothetical protein